MEARITRRTCLGGLLCTATGGAPAWAQGEGLAFEVWRNGSRIGRHAVTLRRDGGQRVAAILVEMAVKIGPIVAFRYRHEATETWDGDRFVSLSSRTTSNGRLETVTAQRADGMVRIVRSHGPVLTAAADAAPLTHWNRTALGRPLFNPQTGALTREAVSRHEGDSVVLADGRSVAATRYALTGDAEIIDWYDASGEWTALRGKAPDGSWLDYRRVTA